MGLREILIASLLMNTICFAVMEGCGKGYGPNTDLSAADWTVHGGELDLLGISCSFIGDVNGDGIDDFAVVASGDDSGDEDPGKVYVFFGMTGGWDGTFDLNDADATYIGEAKGDLAYGRLAGAGDVNGDGYDDILISAYLNGESGWWAGQTYLIFGKAVGWGHDIALSASDASFLGEAGRDTSGASMDGAGDVNGDGFDDILIGSPGNNAAGNGAGKAYLIFGKGSGWAMDRNLSTSDVVYKGVLGDYCGYSVSGAGDLDSDGFDDFMISAVGSDDRYHDGGEVHIFYGMKGGWVNGNELTKSNASFQGERNDNSLGTWIDSAGDMNGDGYEDLAFSAWPDSENNIEAGQTYIVFGGPSRFRFGSSLASADASFLGIWDSERTGERISGAGDVNGDGFDDLLIGAKSNSEKEVESGKTYLILGKGTGWKMDTVLDEADASFLGGGVWDHVGESLSGGGDANGDGLCDILIAAPFCSEGSANSGKVSLIFYQPPPPEGLVAKPVGQWSGVEIIWRHFDFWDGRVFFTIYRSDGISDFEEIGNAGIGGSSFTDDEAVPYGTYSYRIIATDDRGFTSVISEPIRVFYDMDTDSDNVSDTYDTDDDGDGFLDVLDGFPYDVMEWSDMDRDSTGDNADLDDDGDLIPDLEDSAPADPMNGYMSEIESSMAILRSELALLKNETDLNVSAVKASIAELIKALEGSGSNDSGVISDLKALKKELDEYGNGTDAKLAALDDLESIVSRLNSLENDEEARPECSDSSSLIPIALFIITILLIAGLFGIVMIRTRHGSKREE